MFETIKNSWFIKSLILLTLSVTLFTIAYLMYSSTVDADHAAEKVAIQKVNLVCHGNGGIEDADEHEEFWEVRCNNSASFVVDKN